MIPYTLQRHLEPSQGPWSIPHPLATLKKKLIMGKPSSTTFLKLLRSNYSKIRKWERILTWCLKGKPGRRLTCFWRLQDGKFRTWTNWTLQLQEVLSSEISLWNQASQTTWSLLIGRLLAWSYTPIIQTCHNCILWFCTASLWYGRHERDHISCTV